MIDHAVEPVDAREGEASGDRVKVNEEWAEMTYGFTNIGLGWVAGVLSC